jgi:hypothetical protein
MVVDWIDYYEEAVKHSSKPERVLEQIQNCVNDFYGPETRNEIIKRLKFYINR